MLYHNFAWRKENKRQKAESRRLNDTQLQLDVLTTQPALQVYTGDGLTAPFSARAGICLEAQAFPDAPNQPGFPSIVLTPERTYRQRTIYRFTELSDHSTRLGLARQCPLVLADAFSSDGLQF